MQVVKSERPAPSPSVIDVDDESVKSFHRNGWVKVSKVLSDADLARARTIAKEMVAKEDAPRKVARDGFGADANNAEYLKRLRVVNLRDSFPEVIDIAARVAPVVAKLMAVPTLRLWSDMLFIKKGDSDSKPTMWHQDLPKVPIDRRGMVNAWIALDDVPIKRGAMAFASGSQKLGSLGAISQLGEDKDLTELVSNYDWETITDLTSVPLTAGEATFHNGMTLHRAHANQDNVDRIGLGFHFIDGESLFTGAASRYTDGAGLKAFEPFDDELFPIVYQ